MYVIYMNIHIYIYIYIYIYDSECVSLEQLLLSRHPSINQGM